MLNKNLTVIYSFKIDKGKRKIFYGEKLY